MLLQVIMSPKQTLNIKFDWLNDFLILGAKLAKGAHSVVLDLSLGCLVCPGAYRLFVSLTVQCPLSTGWICSVLLARAPENWGELRHGHHVPINFDPQGNFSSRPEWVCHLFSVLCGSYRNVLSDIWPHPHLWVVVLSALWHVLYWTGANISDTNIMIYIIYNASISNVLISISLN